VTTSQQIWKLLEKDLSIQRNLARNLINTRALAKFLIKKYNLNCSLDSVVSSIRRYESDTQWIGEQEKISNLFQKSIIRTRNSLVCFTLKKPIAKHIQELYKKLGRRVTYLKTLTGTHDSKVLVEENDAIIVEKCIPKDKYVSIKSDLSEISITISPEALQTRGVLGRIANELAINNINIEETIVCPPEFILYVKKENTIVAHQTLLRLNGLK